MDSVKPPRESKFDSDGNIIEYGAKFYSDFDDFDIFSGGVKQLTAASDLVKAGRNVVAQALEALDNLPLVNGYNLAVPWPIVQRPDLDPEEWEVSIIETVRIDLLHATQKYLNKRRVEFYVRNPGAIEEGRRAFANVYDSGGTLAIVDGHHRLAALWLLGAEDALAWMLREAQ